MRRGLRGKYQDNSDYQVTLRSHSLANTVFLPQLPDILSLFSAHKCTSQTSWWTSLFTPTAAQIKPQRLGCLVHTLLEQISDPDSQLFRSRDSSHSQLSFNTSPRCNNWSATPEHFIKKNIIAWSFVWLEQTPSLWCKIWCVANRTTDDNQHCKQNENSQCATKEWA